MNKVNKYEQTPQEKIAFIEPGLKELYRNKYALEINIACQQVVDDLRPSPKDEDGKPLKREGKLVQLGESDAMKGLVVGLAEIMARIGVLENTIANLSEMPEPDSSDKE